MRSIRSACRVTASAALSLAVVGCAGSVPSPSVGTSPSPSPPIATATPSSGECSAPLVLEQVKRMLAGREFEAHYLTIGEKFTLSIWLVDPDIDPATPQAGVAEAAVGARDRGLSIAYRVVDEVPCVRHVFEQINPMIVDAWFQHWYKDFLPVRAFADLHDPTPADLVAAVEGAGAALEQPRASAATATASPAPGACTWPEARRSIGDFFGGEDNSTAYLIVGPTLVQQADMHPDDVGVEVQWPVESAAQAGDFAIRDRLGQVARRLGCMSPAVDTLEAFVVDRAGRTLVYAVVTAPVIQSGSVPLPAGGVHLYRLRGYSEP